MRDFLPGYRAYVHASYNEVSPLAIIEAMAAGLPIMAAKIGGILSFAMMTSRAGSGRLMIPPRRRSR